MSSLPTFNGSNSLTLGLELELQLVDLQSFNLAMESTDFLRRVAEVEHPGEIKPEITQGMIEINSSVHSNYEELLQELVLLQKILNNEAEKSNIGLCGGGTHSFQKWKEQRIYYTKRFEEVSKQYGYLAQQFTVFGQHIHIGCPNGDDALYLCHAFAKFIPHFIALSAASPFNQGIDTAFDCSRLTVVSAFPLSGTVPWVNSWEEFERYFNSMANLNIVSNVKDFYWDVRPQPTFGTIEIRVCDAPLTITKAADLAAYAQLIALYLLDTRPTISPNSYLSYPTNRFNAMRYGLNAKIIDPIEQIHLQITDAITQTCFDLESYATEYKCEKALENIKEAALQKENGAYWLRDKYESLQSLEAVINYQINAWA